MKTECMTGWRLEPPLLGLVPRQHDAVDRACAAQSPVAPLPDRWRGRMHGRGFAHPGVESRDGVLGGAPGPRR